ncbi:MAG: TonB-dependent receptor [Ignavibacteriales bacterium]|nr:TonB-dependent receptor [Ignavibacteriales bacterium]
MLSTVRHISSHIVLLAVFTVVSWAQTGDIRGVVTDSTNGERIPFATVQIRSINRAAATNINGFYLISNVPTGSHEVQVSSIGFKRGAKKVVVGLGDRAAADFALAPEPVEVSEVVVTEKAKRELTEINTSVHVLESRDIKAMPVVLQEDIFRAIQILPGIVSTSDVNAHFYVRGGGGDQNLILLDGMRIYNPFHAFGIFSIFDSDIIKTTEVYTGAFPPGYGDRLSSVVNMTTRDGKASGLAGKASLNFVSGKVQVEGPASDQFRWLFSGRKSLFGNSITRAFHKDMPVSFYDWFFKFKREEHESEAQLGVEMFQSGDDLHSVRSTDPDYSWRTSALGITASGLVDDRLFVDAIGFRSIFEAARVAKDGSQTTPMSTKIEEAGVRANATYYTDSHNLYFFGFEFNFPFTEFNLINNGGYLRNVKGSTASVSTWIRYQATIDRLKLDGGLHFDIGSLFTRVAGAEVIQPRINASYALDESMKLKASFGRFTQQFITVNNEDDVISIFDAWIQVPEELRAEQADHYVLGFDVNLAQSLSTTVQVYYKNFRTLVSYNRDKVDQADPDYVNSKGRAFGAEFLVRYGVPELDCYAAYTVSRSEIDASGLVYPPRYDRLHTLNILAVWHAGDALDATAHWEFGSGFPYSQTIGYYDRLRFGSAFNSGWVGETGTPYIRIGEKNAARLPAYHRLDLSVTYRFTLAAVKSSLGFHFINVYDHQNVFYFDRKTGQQVDMLSFFPSLTLGAEF